MCDQLDSDYSTAYGTLLQLAEVSEGNSEEDISDVVVLIPRQMKNLLVRRGHDVDLGVVVVHGLLDLSHIPVRSSSSSTVHCACRKLCRDYIIVSNSQSY